VGTPRAGVPLRATRGIWKSSRPIVYTYRWLRCPAGSKCVRIPRAIRPRFRPTSYDVGTRLRVIVTATNTAGSARVTSRPTPAVSTGKGHVVALWHLDETSGSVMSDSAGANNGTIYRVALGAPGVAGGAYSFNGQNSFVSVPSANDLNPGTANITITLRLKTTSLPAPAPADFDLLRKGTFAVSEYKVELQHSGQASCGFEGSAGYSELIAGPPLNDGQWHEVQCVKAPTAIQLVIDGKVFTQAANVGSISNSAELVIGSHPDGDWYAGNLDEISIAIG
jgi:Concanavalin A-like lectin/glucanases superfamily